MAKKCEKCGQKIGLFGKKAGWHDFYSREYLCSDCWRELGFDDSDVDIYKYKAAAYLMRGKADIVEAQDHAAWIADHTREYSYSVFGVRYKNEDGKDIQKLLAKLPKEGLDSSVFYDCMTNSDIKENFDEDDRVCIFDGIEYDADLAACEFEGEPAVKVYFLSDELGPVHIGWISKQDAPDVSDMIKKHDCSYKLVIEGGKYKHLVYDEETDKCKVVTESGGEYFARVFISYVAEDPAE